MARKTVPDWKNNPVRKSDYRSFDEASVDTILEAARLRPPADAPTRARLLKRLRSAALWYRFRSSEASAPAPSAVIRQWAEIRASCARLFRQLGIRPECDPDTGQPLQPFPAFRAGMLGQVSHSLQPGLREAALELGQEYSDEMPFRETLPGLDGDPHDRDPFAFSSELIDRCLNGLVFLHRAALAGSEPSPDEAIQRGNPGDAALNELVRDLVTIYTEVLGRRARIARSGGKPAGPLFRFVTASLGELEACPPGEEAILERIRRVVGRRP
ncbi:hypothetical protein [Oceanibacterium hippocampi]|uniref:Uncharacterized protein n=1 Tax=Oceanibacterium hippocampi TaxID=745714 RepID=A0A1Y5U023_9PROT|nr:hypothetical protein [Oceanibacterium hippocampi]SLN77825.1 hypothetical protein OCH7691_04562 [Oceanibacterium hippocampi]